MAPSHLTIVEPVASTKSEELSVDVVRNCRSLSDVSSRITCDSVNNNTGENAVSEDEQNRVSLESEDRVETELELEEAGEDIKSFKEKATGEEELKELEETLEAGLIKEKQQQQQGSVATPAATDSDLTSRSISRRVFVPLASKSWRVRAMESNTHITRLMKAALMQTLLHAIRTGSVEGVKVAIERGVQVQYLDSRQRNLVMLASKCDTDARLHIAIILLDAGCDLNHTDQLGWSCLHYAWYVTKLYAMSSILKTDCLRTFLALAVL